MILSLLFMVPVVLVIVVAIPVVVVIVVVVVVFVVVSGGQLSSFSSKLFTQSGSLLHILESASSFINIIHLLESCFKQRTPPPTASMAEPPFASVSSKVVFRLGAFSTLKGGTLPVLLLFHPSVGGPSCQPLDPMGALYTDLNLRSLG